MSYFKKHENRPALTGRTARRADQRHQARNTAREHGTRVITHVHRAYVTISTGWTAREFLIAIGFSEWARYESAFGRATAKVYRESHGTDPRRGAHVIVRGRLYGAFSYNLDDLLAGAKAYARTAALVTAPDFVLDDTRALAHA